MTRKTLIRRADQVTIASLCTLALVAIACYWFSSGGPNGKLVDIDRADRLEYRFVVDVNKADWPELAQLPEIGEVLARRIVATRQQRGEFRSPEELLEVPGVGPRKLARIAPFLAPLPRTEAVAGR